MLPDPLSLTLLAMLSVSQPALARPAPPVRPPSFRFVSAAPPPPSALARTGGLKPLRHPVAKKATAAVAGAIIGALGGMLAGAAVGAMGGGEDGALQGGGIGMFAGAGAGAVLGAWVAR
jgi:hypothetical protein